jgi:hypothetical protein
MGMLHLEDCFGSIFLPSAGKMPEQFAYERLPDGYKDWAMQRAGVFCSACAMQRAALRPACYAAGVTDSGWGRPMKKPCTKSMSIPFTVSSDS